MLGVTTFGCWCCHFSIFPVKRIQNAQHYICVESDRDMVAPAIYERLRGKGYPWKRVNDCYKNGQPKVSPDSFQYALRYTLHGVRRFQPFKTLEDLTVGLGRVSLL
jgi:hypothetical protein